MEQFVGKASIRLKQPVAIYESASVVGKKEGEGPLGLLFDIVGGDDWFGCDTWEAAESALQKKAVEQTIKKAALSEEEFSFLFAGDLLGQSMASSFGMSQLGHPVFGVYGACSTCGEALTLGAMSIAGGFAKKVICVTSSHFASAEKEFRFPLGYGNQRPLSSTWTVTGSAAFLLGRADEAMHRESKAYISGMTVGKIVDYGMKDSMNMGACMAPAAADTILTHLEEFHLHPWDYDKIITGDLGRVGRTILFELLHNKGVDIEERYMDCGIEIYGDKDEKVSSGGSGCGCCAVTLSAYILKQFQEKNWKRVLFVPTGALLSKTSFNEGQSVPGIAHGIVLEGTIAREENN